MAWLTLSPEHVESRFSADEMVTFEDVGGGSGDRLTGILQQVTSLVRAKVAACHKNTLGEAGTIPEECLHAACSIARHNLMASLSSDENTETRKDEYSEANRFLTDVANCKIGVTTEGSSTEVSGSDSGCYGGNPYLEF